jgi:hypothetical protein
MATVNPVLRDGQILPGALILRLRAQREIERNGQLALTPEPVAAAD